MPQVLIVYVLHAIILIAYLSEVAHVGWTNGHFKPISFIRAWR